MIFERPTFSKYNTVTDKSVHSSFKKLNLIQQYSLTEYQKDLVGYINKLENHIREQELKEKWVKNIFVLMRAYLLDKRDFWLNKDTNKLFVYKISELLKSMEREQITMKGKLGESVQKSQGSGTNS